MNAGLTFFEITTAMGLAPLRPPRGRGGGPRGRHGRPARFDQRRPPLGIDHHQHLVLRPHPSARQHIGGDRPPRRPGSSSEAGRPSAGFRGGEARALDPPRGRAAALPDCTSWARTSVSTRSRPNLPVTRPTPFRVAAWTWRTDWGVMFRCRSWVRTRATMRRSPWRGSTSWPRRSRGWRSDRTPWPAPSRPCSGRRGSRSSAIGRSWSSTARKTAPRPWPSRIPSAPASRGVAHPGLRHHGRQGHLAASSSALLPIFDEVIAARFLENPRSLSPETIASAVLMLTGRAAHTAADPAEALELAR